ncbi:uncharacterized protein I303_105929 [Kwoniella dejecticola CBS 10117]|uniref:Ubiquitin-conjugating enzyme E2 J1 n=1 Tax=Kwoniella dejecticola CBS 10117 TaxID=1296121 RepID=A0A1A6A0T3_9TREE|nr:ubiquitin-conjugating enzyme E2 J1 [Kwoniella dejecticola CBS 10117]OBR83672.1 ubiquitin-conjugating enzyme E2 J1 [Kwoniella dejecticola CBS 10117]
MSSSRPKVNLRSTAVKRIMQEASELASADIDEDGFVAAPLEDDIFEWHCTMRGVSGSEYDGGLYHLRILLPPSYPMSAPDIMLMTPNGRFELGKKICIDGLTSFHAGSWQPAWGVRTAVVGLRSFWMQSGEALSAIGALDYSKEERKRLALLSKGWKCPQCGVENEEIISSVSVSAAASANMGDKSRAKDDEKGNENEDGKEESPMEHVHQQEEGISRISIDPNPQETPNILPPSSISTTSLGTNTHTAAGDQALPVGILPPDLEGKPKPPDSSDDSYKAQDTSSDTDPHAAQAPLTSTNHGITCPQHAASQPSSHELSERPNTLPPPLPASSITPATPTGPIMPPTLAPSRTVPQAHDPQIQQQQQQLQRSPVFYLIDSMILAGVSILIMLIAKRLA